MINMKKFVSFIGALLLAVTLSFSLVGCGENSVSIQYGKKYTLGSQYYVFSKNGTGYTEKHYTETNGDGYTTSGRVDFIWRTASDNKVYLFETNRKYYEDNTSGKTVSLTDKPLSFGKDFFVLTAVSGYVGMYGGSVGESCTRYIVEDSDLWKKTRG